MDTVPNARPPATGNGTRLLHGAGFVVILSQLTIGALGFPELSVPAPTPTVDGEFAVVMPQVVSAIEFALDAMTLRKTRLACPTGVGMSVFVVVLSPRLPAKFHPQQ